MKRLYLVRHGQTSWNLEGRTQGGKLIRPASASNRQKNLQSILKTLNWIKSIPALGTVHSTARIIAKIKNLIVNWTAN